MKRLLINTFVLVSSLAASNIWATSANATAFAGVNYSFWFANLSNYIAYIYGDPSFAPIPDGVEVYCDGALLAPGGYCGRSLSLSITNNHSGYIAESVFATDSITVTNSTDESISAWLHFNTQDSAFNPGGSPIGASVTDPFEWASFASYIDASNPIGDKHSCTVGPLDLSLLPATCGVSLPDQNGGELLLPIPAPGGSVSFDVSMGIELATFSAPEPATLALFGAGLAAAAAMRRRRRTNSNAFNDAD